MKKIVFASALSIVMLACGETPGSGTDSNQSPNGPSNANSTTDSSMMGDTSMRGGGTDSSGIPAMSTDSSQLKASSDSAMKKHRNK